MTCTANAGTPVQVRSAGITEPLGDVIFSCTGGTPTVVGQPIPAYTLTATLTANITSRLLDASGLSEAALLIDEPFPASPIPSTAMPPAFSPPQIFCAPASSPCVETGTGGATNPYLTQPNVFLGKVTTPQTVTFTGIPIDPAPSGQTRYLRLVNLRANASQVGLSSTLIPNSISAAFDISGSPTVLVQNTTQTVALISPGLVAGGSSASLSSCSPHNTSLIGAAGTPAFDFNLTVREGYSSSTLRRNVGLTIDGATTAPLYEQNVPGYSYRIATESNLYIPSLITGYPEVGLADFGTRFKITFHNVGSGVRLFLPVTVPFLTPGGTLPNFVNFLGIPGISTAQIRLLQAASDGNSAAGFTSAIATSTIAGIPVAEAAYSGTDAYAIYEVEQQAVAQVTVAPIRVAVAYNAAQPRTTSVSIAFAPSGGVLSSIPTADSIAPIPRFIDDSTPFGVYSIDCVTQLTLNSNPTGLFLTVDGNQAVTLQSDEFQDVIKNGFNESMFYIKIGVTAPNSEC